MSRIEPIQPQNDEADPAELAAEIATRVENFVAELKKIGAGESPEQVLSLLLLETSQLLLVGSWLGAMPDVDGGTEGAEVPDDESVPAELREQLATLLGAADSYVEASDPFDDEPELIESQMSDDLFEIAVDLSIGLSLFHVGRVDAALSYWQVSYLADWGTTLTAVHRAVQYLVSYVRLDEDEDDLADDAEADDVEAGEEVTAAASDS